MKKIHIALAIFSIAQSVSAANVGPYIGIGLGEGIIRTPTGYAFISSSNTQHRGGFSGRVFGGYTITPFFGLEMGYTRYASSGYKATSAGANSSLSYQANATDIVAKGYLPIGSYFNAYVLGGVSLYREQLRFTNGGIPLTSSFAVPGSGLTNANHTRPIYGAGINITPTHNITTGLELTRVQALGNFSQNVRATAYTDLVTWNVAYTFS